MGRATLRNLAFAVTVGVVLGLGPLTSTHLEVSIAGGVLAGAAVFGVGWRRQRTLAPESAERRALASPPLRVWAVLLVLGVVFAPTGRWLLESWTGSIFKNSYGLLVPLIMAVLAHATLSREGDAREESSPWGLVPVGLGLGMVALDAGIRTHYLSVLGLIVCLPGLSLVFFGARRTRALALPLCLGLFLMPLPNVLASAIHLREITLAGMVPLLERAGIPVLVDHLLITLPGDHHYLVSDNCAGFQLLLAGLGMAMILAFHTDSTLRKLLVLALAVPLAVAWNVLRSVLLLGICHYLGPALFETPLVHGATGVLAFGALLLSVLAMADRRALRHAFA